MQKININRVPEFLSSGLITEQTARNIIWEELFNFPFKYGIAGLTEDQRSSFLLDISDRFIGFVKKYQKNTVHFEFFLGVCLQKYVRNWRRKEARKFSSENCLRDQIFLAYESKENENKIDMESFLDSQKKYEDIKRKLVTSKPKSREVLQNYIHLCACKACNEIDSHIINRVSEFIGMELKDFSRQIEGLRLATREKYERRNELITSRDRAFFFHKRALYELTNTDEDTRFNQKIRHQYDSQTETWKSLNETLKNRFKISPSTVQIADTTGMPLRKVYFYLNHKSPRSMLPFIEKPDLSRGKNDTEE